MRDVIERRSMIARDMMEGRSTKVSDMMEQRFTVARDFKERRYTIARGECDRTKWHTRATKLIWFGGFYGISTFVGYLTPNPFLCK